MRPAQVLVVLILCSGYIGQTEGNWYPCTQNSDCDWCDAHPGRNYDYPTRCEIGDSDGNKFCMYIWAWTGKWCECSQVPQCQICSECCGNGQVEGGEQCDDGNSDHTDGCVECWHPRCGDGHTHSGVEQCDDGNSVHDDACSNWCVANTCSDSVQNQGEAGVDCGGPCAVCRTGTCSDGIQNQGEAGIDCGGGACAVCGQAGAAVQLAEINVPYSGHSYSSTINNEAVGTYWARGQLDSSACWLLTHQASVGEWMQFDLGTVKPVGGVVVQPRPGNDERVLAYKVKVSTDGTNFQDVDNSDSFTGNGLNDDSQARANGYFSSLYMAQYVRIEPLLWYKRMSMRAGLLLLAETCSDGLQNQGEAGVDCGGPCGACCGNGLVDAGEQCDDGNSVDTDSCSNACACTEFQFVPGSTEISDSVACVRPPFNTPICQEARTHRQLDLAFDARKGPNRGAVSGGLGRDMTDDDRFQSWKCLKSHACLSAPGVDGTAEDFMCFAYDEQQKKFIPWGKQSNLRLF